MIPCDILFDEIVTEPYYLKVLSKNPEILKKIENPQKFGVTFEKIVSEMFRRAGKKATPTPYHDNGVDIIVDTEFEKSPMRFLVQCKIRKNKNISKKDIEAFFYKVNMDPQWTNHTKAIFVTNSKYSKSAISFASKYSNRLEIWDPDKLSDILRGLFSPSNTFGRQNKKT